MSDNNFKYNPQKKLFESRHNIELTKDNLNLSLENICSILGLNQEFKEYLISIKDIKSIIRLNRKKGFIEINFNNSQEFLTTKCIKKFNEHFLVIDEKFKSLKTDMKKIWQKPKTISQVINFILSFRSLLEFIHSLLKKKKN